MGCPERPGGPGEVYLEVVLTQAKAGLFPVAPGQHLEVVLAEAQESLGCLAWQARGRLEPEAFIPMADVGFMKLGDLQDEEAQAHRERYERGEALAPIAWYEPDTRSNFDVGEGWTWGRLAATENGIHYISSDNLPGPRVVVDPDIAQWIPYSRVGKREDVFLRGQKPRRFAEGSTLGVMEDDDLWTPMTYPYSAISLNLDFATTVALRVYPEIRGHYDDPRWPSNDPAFQVPFCLPDPSGQGGWVAVMGSQVHVPPIPGPWRNSGNGPLQVLWVNGAGEWGYSSHPDTGPGSLWRTKGSLRTLRATVRPVREFKEFEMPPQEFVQGMLEASAEDGWPLERLIALARGDISVDNPTLKLWLEDGNPDWR